MEKQQKYDFQIITEYDDGEAKTENIVGTKMTCFALESTPILAIMDGADEVFLQILSSEMRAKRIGKAKRRAEVVPCES